MSVANPYVCASLVTYRLVGTAGGVFRPASCRSQPLVRTTLPSIRLRHYSWQTGADRWLRSRINVEYRLVRQGEWR